MIKVNYQLELEKILNNLKGKPRLLLHACCGVCSSYVLEYLSKYFEITVLYYNPNIYPRAEYDKRLLNQKKIIDEMVPQVKLKTVTYDENEFLDYVDGLEGESEGGARCTKCFILRMEKTAIIAKEENYDYFCTTLSVSPYKDSQRLNKIGKYLEEKYGVKYLYSDFKKKNGYKRSNELAREYDIYRQDYCGCRYSIRETLNH